MSLTPLSLSRLYPGSLQLCFISWKVSFKTHQSLLLAFVILQSVDMYYVCTFNSVLVVSLKSQTWDFSNFPYWSHLLFPHRNTMYKNGNHRNNSTRETKVHFANRCGMEQCYKALAKVFLCFLYCLCMKLTHSGHQTETSITPGESLCQKQQSQCQILKFQTWGNLLAFYSNRKLSFWPIFSYNIGICL
jgi:hypothetical protein